MSTFQAKHCQYQLKDGSYCQEPLQQEGWCFWHDPTIDKTGPEIKSALERQVKAGKTLEGYVLINANLEDAHLVEADLSHADLSHANLRKGHLYHNNLKGANLIKTDFTRANLNRADLRQANLLGTQLSGARLEQTKWGDTLIQEDWAHSARKANEQENALDFYEQAEELYRELRQEYEVRRQFERAGIYFYREMNMRRHQLPLFSMKRLLSTTVELLCGYGEKPLRLVLFATFVIFGSAFLYFLLGVEGKGGVIDLQMHIGIKANLTYLWECLYFSIVTFTTLGYGDIVPIGISRVIAAIEALVGTFTIALFLVVFVKRMTR